MRKFVFGLAAALVVLGFVSCDSTDLDILDGDFPTPDPKPINKSLMGVNNFFNSSGFGTISQQYLEMRDTLGVNKVRVLFAWSDDVQPTASSQKFIGFYNDIVRSAPAGVDLLVVVAHTPSWMTDPSTWTNSNPRQMWIDEWFRPLVQRFSGNPQIVGWEIWNEPDLTRVGADSVLELEDPANYMELLSAASNIVRTFDPGKMVIGAATMSIAENYPNNLIYNERLRDLGALDIVDVWNVHYYGMNLAQLNASGAVADFLNSLGKVIWITESGKAGPTSQVDYVERMWPHLREKVPAIDRIYYYEFASNQSAESSFGLRTGDAEFPVSDLYLQLRDGRQ